MEAHQPFFHRHLPKNALLILLSLLCLPISGLLTLVAILHNYHHDNHKSSKNIRNGNGGSKTILVTGVSMTKGLVIARLLGKHTHHHIIAADLEPVPFTSPGRYCRFISEFTRLNLSRNCGTDEYTENLLKLMKKKKVDLWISCSSVVNAVEDGRVMKLAERTMGPDFRAMQFDEDVVTKLHEKDALMDYLAEIGCLVPESYRCTSADEVEKVINVSSSKDQDQHREGKSFILKPIGVDDKARAHMMTLLPFPGDKKNDLKAYLSSLNISASRPFLLQQHIQGYEYCTHSLVIDGKVKAFVSCPSSDLLMHYEALPQESVLNKKMLQFTQHVAEQEGSGFSGHLSFDFIAQGKGEKIQIYPIECNPRAHTAVVLFNDTPAMAAQYLTCFDAGQQASQDIIFPRKSTTNTYWIGHDLVALALAPCLTLLCQEENITEVLKALKTFWDHLLYWHDGTFDSTDPLPFLVLYHIYWPTQFFKCLLTGQKWSRINVSTTKIFEI